jgi:hypothetical protein
MPRTTERKGLLQDLETLQTLKILLGEEDDAVAREIFSLHALICTSRYLDFPVPFPKSREFVEEFFLALPDRQFKQVVRMSKAAFEALTHKIENHEVFHNNSTAPQRPVYQQLAVALFRFGHGGNAAGVTMSGLHFGCSVGAACLYFERVMVALLHLVPEFVRWPNKRQRLQHSKEMAKTGFAGCVGFVDGTHVRLFQRPSLHGEVYFDRKSNYSLNAQVVCDRNRLITYFYSGWPGEMSSSFGTNNIVEKH